MKANKKAIGLIDDDAGMIQMLPTVAFAVIMLFAIVYIGTYMNGTIASQLASTYPDNDPSGSIDNTYWHNGTTTSTYRNITLPCTAGELTGSTTSFKIYANVSGQPIQYNLSTNGHTTYANQSVSALAWHNTTLTTLISNGNVSSSDQYLNFTWDVNNSNNSIKIRVYGTYYNSGDYRTTLENASVNTLINLTAKYDSTLEIVVVAAIITVLTIPLMAVVAIKKLI